MNDKITTLSTLLQQVLDNTKQSNTAIAVMQSSMQDTLKRQQDTVAGSVVPVSTKVDQMSDDFKSVRESVLDTANRLGKLDAKMADLQNAINILKNPPPPPAPALTTPTGGPGTGAPGGPITSNTIVPSAPPP